jgi:hypothetical protein
VCVLVRHDSEAKTLNDLKGASLAVPRRTREHCHVFLERHCTGCGSTPATFFQRTSRPFTVEDAMLALVQGRVNAVLTDGASVEAYRESRPAGFAKLKVLTRSETFPPAVFVYRPPVEEPAALPQRSAQTHEHAESKEVMTFQDRTLRHGARRLRQVPRSVTQDLPGAAARAAQVMLHPRSGGGLIPPPGCVPTPVARFNT